MDSIPEFCRALTHLTLVEQGWLTALLKGCESGPASLSEIWRNAWFTRNSERMLILQPETESGYLYVPPESLSNAHEILSSSLAAALLLDEMRQCGAVKLHRTTHGRSSRLRCVGEIFNTPHIVMHNSKPRIVLNAEGDYTETPTEIRNAKDQVAYAGMALGNDAYALMQAYTSGMIMIRPSVRATLQCCLPPKRGKAAPATTSELPASGILSPPSSATATTSAEHSEATSFDFRLGGAHCSRALPSAWRPRRQLSWRTALLIGKLLLAVGFAIGIYSDELGELLSLTSTSESTKNAPLLGASVPPPKELPKAPEHWPVSIEEPPAQITAPTLQSFPVGMDISQWSGHGSRGARSVLEAVPKLHFAFVRAAYGTRLDHEFQSNWSLLSKHDIYRGAYLFFRLDEDPEAQVEAAIDALGPASAKDLCLTIDIEEQSFNLRAPLPSREEVRAKALAALQHARDRLGCSPIVYTNWNVGSQYLADGRFTEYPLWIADWTGAASPKLPSAWSRFAFWQRSNTLPHSPAPADLDIFHGTLDELASMVRRPIIEGNLR